jgi:hypothetical protein
MIMNITKDTTKNNPSLTLKERAENVQLVNFQRKMTESGDLKKSREIANQTVRQPEQMSRANNMVNFRKVESRGSQDDIDHHEVAEELKKVKEENSRLKAKVKKLE